MVFANYGRKSIFSDKSDSVDNQFRMAKDYAEYHFSGKVEQFLQYSDEDYTGANANRPDLKRLLLDIESGLIDVLIVYQIDRLSRDIRDFVNIYSTLEEHGVEFISVKENIDTTTPIGKAMMYIAVIFAQMERETIAQRVTDNMIGLAKKGYWTGGNPPCGYIREKIVVDGRKHCTIVTDPDGVEFVKSVYTDFLERATSLQNLETLYKHEGKRTPSGAFFSTTQLYKILTMPYCVEATPQVYDFYINKGCRIESPKELWNGTHGVMIYGRSSGKNKKHQLQDPSEWIVCVGMHEPFIDSDTWLKAQSKFSQNKILKQSKYEVPLLKGVIRCKCGRCMQVSRKKLAYGKIHSAYYCVTRNRKGVEYCNVGHTPIELLDEKVMEIFRNIEECPSLVENYVKSTASKDEDINIDNLNKKINATDKKIKKLTESLSLTENDSVAKYIIDEIENLTNELKALKTQGFVATSQQNKKQEIVKKSQERATEISKLIHNFDQFSAAERNEIVRSIVSECIWDGHTLFVRL